MGSPASHHMFRNFNYQKPIPEIKEAMERKIESLRAKITEREGRIVRIREEHDISDADLINLLAQAADEAISNRRVASMSYNLATNGADGSDVRIIAAGVVQNLVTEKSLIEQEKKSVDQLQLIVRNLGPVTRFGDNGEEYTQEFYHLSYDELDFLGF